MMQAWIHKLNYQGKLRRFAFNFGLLLGGLLLIYQFFLGVRSFAGMDRSIIQIPLFILLAIILAMAAIIFQITGWVILMGALGENIPFIPAVRGYVLSFLPRYIPGTVWGYVSRSVWLKNEFGIDYSLANIGSILEVLTIIFGNIIVVAIGGTSDLPLNQRIILISVSLLMPIIFGLVIWYVINYKQKSILVFKINLKKLRLLNWITSVCLCSGTWIIFGTSLAVLYKSVFPEFDSLSLSSIFHLAASYNLSWLVGFLILFIPSGLGIREFMLANQLAVLSPDHPELASAIAVLFRLIVTLAEIFWLIAWIKPFSKKLFSKPVNLSK